MVWILVLIVGVVYGCLLVCSLLCILCGAVECSIIGGRRILASGVDIRLLLVGVLILGGRKA